MSQITKSHGGTPPADALTSIYTPSCSLSCFPPHWGEYWFLGVGYYSPAICPSGWTVACSRFSANLGPPVESDETAMLCCPSQYTCSPDLLSFCASGISTGYSPPAIQIRWASSDLSILETNPLTPRATFTNDGSSATTPITTSRALSASSHVTNPSISPSQNAGSNLSTGAKAGIGVGVAFALVIIAIAIGAFIHRKYRSRSPAPLGEALYNANDNNIPEPAQEKPGQPHMQILPSELDSVEKSKGWTPMSEPTSNAIAARKTSIPEAPVNASLSPTSELSGQQSLPTAVPPVGVHEITTIDIRNNPAAAELPSHSPVASSPVSGHIPEKIVTNEPSNVTSVQVQQAEHSRAEKLAQLKEELERIQGERSRLLQLQELAEKEERIKRQIAEVERNH